MGERIRYMISWMELRGERRVRNKLVTPHMDNAAQATIWLFKQKPYLKKSLTALGSLEVKQWDRNRGVAV